MKKILLPLRSYEKSNFGEFKQSKNVIFDNFRDSELCILVNLVLESCSNLLKIKFQNLQNCQKWHFWTVWIHQNLISHKIGVAVHISTKSSHNLSFWKFLEHSAKTRVLINVITTLLFCTWLMLQQKTWEKGLFWTWSFEEASNEFWGLT